MKLGDVEKELPSFAGEAIASATAAGAKRSAGAIEADLVSTHILTSSGTVGHDAKSSILLNIRSFTDRNASGHALSCSATLKAFDPAGAGRRAGEDSKRMLDSKPPGGGDLQGSDEPDGGCEPDLARRRLRLCFLGGRRHVLSRGQDGKEGGRGLVRPYGPRQNRGRTGR